MGRFGQHLVEEGKLLPDELKKVIEMQQHVGGRLGTNILELGLVREEELLESLGRFRQTRTVSTFEFQHVSHEVLKLVPPQIARRHSLVPVERRGNTLVIASVDPIDPLVEDELGYLTSCLVRTVIGLELRIQEALGRYYGVPQTARLSGLTRRLVGASGVHSRPRSAATSPVQTVAPPSPPPAAAAPEPSRPTPRRTLPSARRKTVPEQPKSAAPSETEIRYVELDDDTKKLIYTDDPASQTPPARLDAAAYELQGSSIRDEIGDVILSYCKPYLKRRLLLIQRKGSIVGWRGEGKDIELEKVRAIAVPPEEPSVFLTLQQGTDFWLGPLAPLKAHGSLNDALGDPPPQGCLVLPITLRKRVVSFIYGDNGAEGVSSVPLAEIKRLATKAGVAFEVCILKNKIRTL